MAAEGARYFIILKLSGRNNLGGRNSELVRNRGSKRDNLLLPYLYFDLHFYYFKDVRIIMSDIKFKIKSILQN